MSDEEKKSNLTEYERTPKEIPSDSTEKKKVNWDAQGKDN